jgi:hypothetical protein
MVVERRGEGEEGERREAEKRQSDESQPEVKSWMGWRAQPQRMMHRKDTCQGLAWAVLQAIYGPARDGLSNTGRPLPFRPSHQIKSDGRSADSHLVGRGATQLIATGSH